MVGIPRFEAQLQSISVPSMNNYQQEQNAEVYKAVANFANVSGEIASNLYKEEKKHEAEIQGAEDVENAVKEGKNFDLNSLPSPITPAQKAYNQSAINAFNAQYTVDTSLALTNLENENRDNPYEFLTKAQSYIDGASSDIPAHLKPQIVKPIEMNARSIYASLLRKKIARDKDSSKVTTLLSVDDMIRDALNTEDPNVQDTKIGQTIAIIGQAGEAGDFTPELAQKKVKEIRMGVANQRLSDQLISAQYDVQKQQQIINMAMAGRTGILAFDNLSPAERQEAIKDSLNHIAFSQGYIGQVAEQKQKYVIAQATVESYNNLIPNQELTSSVLKEISWGNKTFYNMLERQEEALFGYPSDEAYFLISDGVSNGTLNEKQIIDAYEGGYITGKDAMVNLSSLFSPLSQNKKKQSYQTFKSNLDLQMKDIFNNIGAVSQKNVKKEFIESNMDEYLKEDRSDEEIMQFSELIEDKANKMFKPGTEYEKVHTPSWFKEKTGYDISSIENAVKSATINGNIDMKKLRSTLLDMSGNDKDMASKLYSYYLAVINK